MKSTPFLLLIILLLSSSASAIVEVDLVVSPTIAHYYDPGDEFLMMDPSIMDKVTFYPPDAGLTPGETYRINFTFNDGRMLKFFNGVQSVSINSRFLTGSISGGSQSVITHDAVVSLNITDSVNFSNLDRSQGAAGYRHSTTGVYNFSRGFGWLRSSGEIIDGSILKGFTVEFTAPTVVDGELFTSQLYTNNRIEISAFLNNPSNDRPLIEIVACENQPSTDTNGDCKIDIVDFANMAAEWMMCGLSDQSLCWP